MTPTITSYRIYLQQVLYLKPNSVNRSLVAAVSEGGNLRDRAIIVLMLHTGLRARELCKLTRVQVTLGKRSGMLFVRGKHNKHREIPLNATARAILVSYDSELVKPSQDTTRCFSLKKGIHNSPNGDWTI